jgi:hypothetical protein
MQDQLFLPPNRINAGTIIPPMLQRKIGDKQVVGGRFIKYS